MHWATSLLNLICRLPEAVGVVAESELELVEEVIERADVEQLSSAKLRSEVCLLHCGREKRESSL